MLKIDFHTHAFPDAIANKTIALLSKQGGIPPFSDGTETGTVQVLKEAGISMGIVLPVVTKPEQFPSVTRFAAAVNEKYRADRESLMKEGFHRNACLLSFGGIHPDSANYKAELKQLSEQGFLGIKLHPDYQGVNFDDIRYMRIIEYATELGLIVVTHAGVDIGFPDCVRNTPKMAKRVISEVQPDKLVLAHMGGYGLWEEVLECLAGESVYFDTAFCFGRMPSEQMHRLISAHSENRILFATDCPWGKPTEFTAQMEQLELTEEQKSKIFGKNALRLLGFSE